MPPSTSTRYQRVTRDTDHEFISFDDIRPGHVIYAPVLLSIYDFRNPHVQRGERGHSTTFKKVRDGQKVNRLCVVLAKSRTELTVTYLASFTNETTANALPDYLDRRVWLAVTPAIQEPGMHPRLPDPAVSPTMRSKAQWVSLRTTQVVQMHPGEQFRLASSMFFSPESVEAIRGAMLQ